MIPKIHNRRDLIYALSQAADLEHALCCLYLYAAFSLKTRPDESGISKREFTKIQNWRMNILLVARQEMEHLGLVCNLLTSIGASPHFRRANFPIPADSYGELDTLILESFSTETMSRFIKFEQPEYLFLRQAIHKALVDVSDFEIALSIILRKVCVDTHWDYGEVWIPQEDNAFSLGSAWYPANLNENDDVEAFRTKTVQLAQANQITVTPEMWTQCSFPLATQAQLLQGREELAKKAGLNTGTVIPILHKGQPIAVLAFFYQTFTTTTEDDEVVELIQTVVNGLEDEPNEVGALLSQPQLTTRAVDRFETAPPLMPAELKFSTIGGFYRQIRRGFLYLAHQSEEKLFIGPVDAQVTNSTLQLREGWYNVKLLEATNLASALQIINEIIEQGEGATRQDEDSHYARFVRVQEELQQCKKANPDFAPARPVASNPCTKKPKPETDLPFTLITDPFTSRVVDIFNAAYETMLYMLIRFYAHTDETQAQLDGLQRVAFFPFMTMIIRPLGELLTQLPAGSEKAGVTAGPSFELLQDISLLPHRKSAWLFLHERLQELAVACTELSQTPQAPSRLTRIANNLTRLAYDFEQTMLDQEKK